MNVLLLGANGQLGRAIVAKLTGEGHHLKAFMRHPKVSATHPNVECFQGDATDEMSVVEASMGQDVVVNAIGSGTLRRNTIESDTTRVVLRALARTTVRKYLAMSAGMVAPVSFVFDNIVRPLFLGNLFREHRLVEELVRASNLDWTIVRPPRLSNRPARGYLEATDKRPKGPIILSRADVADFISKVLATDAYRHQAVFLTSR
jgi:uncharacterized protein YbjT (DUF2867 family)